MTDKIVVLSTCANLDEAERLARALVEGHLAACVNLIPGVRSFYRWKGEVESGEECLLVIKSSRPSFGALRLALEKVHSYEVPEAIAIQIVEGSANYLNWLASSLQPPPEPAE
jgi:periplasmic divalent cation tolerance protein